ncbi:MAG: DUF2807 domain-containing protein [Anaerolineae bacterium]|nr:DUF2807 domain-containing protein [Anaerolineae bacterium]
MKKVVIVVLSLFLVLSVACSCTFLNFNRVPDIIVEAGSGNVVTRDYEIKAVSNVEIESLGTLHLVQGDTPSLTIEAEDNYIDKFEVVVRGDRLVIKVEQKWYDAWIPTEPIHYYLTLPTVSSIKLAGAIRLESDELNLQDLTLACAGANDVDLGTLNAASVTLDISGAANVKAASLEAESVKVIIAGLSSVNLADLAAETLDLHISGTGNMEAAGEVNRQSITVEGGGNVMNGNLKCADVSVKSSGMASATVWATETLDLDCDGAVNVSYYGSPTLTQNNNGMVSINALGEK